MKNYKTLYTYIGVTYMCIYLFIYINFANTRDILKYISLMGIGSLITALFAISLEQLNDFMFLKEFITQDKYKVEKSGKFIFALLIFGIASLSMLIISYI